MAANSGGIQPVGVRLTVEAQQEFIEAFRRAEATTQRFGKSAEKSTRAFSSSLSDLTVLVEGFGAALAGIGLTQWVNQAGEAAELLKNLHARFQSTVTDLSAIGVAARQSGSDLASVAGPLTRLFNAMTEASQDLSGDAADRLRDVGLTTREIARLGSLDLAGRLEVLAHGFSRIKDPIERSNAELRLLGDRGAVLIPILNAISERGFDGLRTSADRLSSLMTKELVEAAGAVNDAFGDMRIQAEGVGTAFTAGLAPGLTAGVAAMTDEVSKGTAGWIVFGEAVGEILGFLTVAISTLVDSVHTRLTTLAANFASLFRAAAAAATGHLDEARTHMEAIGLRRAREEDLLVERVNRAWDQFLHRDELRARKRADTTNETNDTIEKREKAAARDRLAAQKAAAEAELSVTKATLKLRQDTEDAAFEAGTRSIAAHYAERRAIVEAASEAELSSLQKQRAVAEAQGTKGLAEVAKIDGQIRALDISRKDQLLELGAQEAAAARSLGEERLALDRKIAETQGDQHTARLLAIDEEIRKTDEFLSKTDNTAAENEAILNQLQRALGAGAEFDRLSSEAAQALSDFSRDRAAIERRAQAGLLSQADATAQILALEKDRLPVLERISGELQSAAGATGDAERISRAKDQAAAVDELSVAYEAQTKAASTSAGAIDAAEKGLEGLFGEGIRTAPTFAAAFKNMAASVGASVQDLIGRFLALRLVTSFLSAFGRAKSPIQGISGQASDVYASADGGPVPGLGTGDIVPAMLEPKEFVVRRAVSTRPGMPAFLSDLNAGRIRPAARTRYLADGGFAGGSGLVTSGVEGGALNIGLGLDPGLILQTMESSAGQRVTVRTLGRNRRAAGRAIGGS